MRKRILCAALVLSLSMGLTACSGAGAGKEVSEYKKDVETFYNTLVDVDKEINDIDPSSQEAMDKLFEEFDKLQSSYSQMAELTVPTKDVPEAFAYISDLADEASSYMTQANEYLKQSFDDSSYNENTLKAALECYNRANKRAVYIVSLLNGELPKDENISYE